MPPHILILASTSHNHTSKFEVRDKRQLGVEDTRVPICVAIEVSKDFVSMSSLEPPRRPGSRGGEPWSSQLMEELELGRQLSLRTLSIVCEPGFISRTTKSKGKTSPTQTE